MAIESKEVDAFLSLYNYYKEWISNFKNKNSIRFAMFGCDKLFTIPTIFALTKASYSVGVYQHHESSLPSSPLIKITNSIQKRAKHLQKKLDLPKKTNLKLDHLKIVYSSLAERPSIGSHFDFTIINQFLLEPLEPSPILEYVHSLLNPNGICLISCFFYWGPSEPVAQLGNNLSNSPWSHLVKNNLDNNLSKIKKSELETLFQEIGFTVLFTHIKHNEKISADAKSQLDQMYGKFEYQDLQVRHALYLIQKNN